MNAQKLIKQDGTDSGLWICGRCAQTHHQQDLAEKCCLCRTCGKDMEGKHGITCFSCSDAEYARRRAQALEKAEEVQDYSGWVWDGGDYYESLDDYLERLEADYDPADWPEFVFCCRELDYLLDADAILQDLVENACVEEDPELEGVEAFKAACEAFNEANKDFHYYDGDFKHKVRVPREGPGEHAAPALAHPGPWRPGAMGLVSAGGPGITAAASPAGGRMTQ